MPNLPHIESVGTYWRMYLPVLATLVTAVQMSASMATLARCVRETTTNRNRLGLQRKRSLEVISFKLTLQFDLNT
ncbi:hypothetical protein [Calothrix sp. NIES-3974]|uniref:hypothetical protein n=1 Tax=Calothrix sp. NIES-3974 TaxID=2005462 RepID=UPI0012FDE0EA|nr:hypothetical protein [Calothrix sp. NIES-3974]